MLFVDDETGANDLVMSPTDPKTIYASTYQRRRTACCVNGGGPGSGIWKSIDGGDTWTRLSGGIPAGSLGRIGLDVYRKNGNIVYASIEAQGPPGGRGGRGAVDPASGDAAVAGRGGGGAGCGGAAPGESGLYRSDDGGATWHTVSTTNPRPLYFSQVRIDPNNPDRVFQGGVKMSMTIDGGKTMEGQASLVAHDDVHAIWIDPNNSDHMIIGDDGGVYASYDGAKTWNFFAQPAGRPVLSRRLRHVACRSTSAAACRTTTTGAARARRGSSSGIMNYDWFQIQGGDGFVAIPDRRDARWIYSESQDGNMTRRNKITGESKSIRPNAQNVTPAPKPGEAFRLEWDTPMIVSPNDPGTLIVAANRVFVSHDRGDSWTVISPDLTTNANRDTIVTMGLKGSEIRISRERRRVAVADDRHARRVAEAGRACTTRAATTGCVYVSRDGGKSWQNITKNLPGFPAGALVSEVVPSAYDAGTVYVTVDNHRLNDYEPYIWVSTDFGATFQSIVDNLTGENVRTLTEDQRNRDVLYIGTETGIFLSLDRGKSWAAAQGELPERARRRDHDPSARQRDARRDARPRALDSRPPRADSGIRGAAQSADAKLFTRADRARVEDEGRSQRRVLGTSVLRRRESAERGGRSVFPQAAGDRSQASRQRRRRQDGARADDSERRRRRREFRRSAGTCAASRSRPPVDSAAAAVAGAVDAVAVVAAAAVEVVGGGAAGGARRSATGSTARLPADESVRDAGR